MNYAAGDRVYYQPNGKGTKRFIAMLKEIADERGYMGSVEGKFKFIEERFIVGKVKK